MKWRAWYAEGRTQWTTYASTEWTWEDLPPEGMVGVVVYLSETVTPYRQIADGGDWYWHEDGRVQLVPTHAEWGEFAPAPDVPAEVLKKSGVMDDDAWAEVHAEMMASVEAP